MQVICGQTGSGKSYWALRMAQATQPLLNGTEFTINQVCFKGSELMRKINSNEYPVGTIFIWDEAGVGMSSRDFMSVINKMLVFMMQTVRHRRYVFILTVPDFSFIDAGARKLIHSQGEMKSINFANNTSNCEIFMLQHNSRSGKTYYKHLRVIKNGIKRRVPFFRLGLPEGNVLAEYEKIKRQFTDELNEEIENKLSAIEEKDREASKPKEKKPLTEKQQQVYELLKKGLMCQEVAKQLNITQPSVSRHKALIEKKGYITTYKPNAEANQLNAIGSEGDGEVDISD